MDETMRNIVDSVKADMLKTIEQIRKLEAVVPVSGTRYELPLKGRTINIVYYSAKKENAPLILGFHGGGFLFGGAAMDDAMWSAVSEQLGVNIASVGYRMTPEYMWPAPIEDAYDVAVYMVEHADEFGFDASKISVMGCSAGANIAAAVSLYAKEHGKIKFDHQILIYPDVDCATDPAEKQKGSMDLPMFYVFNELYVKPEDAANKLCSPIMATEEELRDLPTAIVCVADNDTLKEEGQAYAEKLKSAGNTVFLAEPEPDMPHGYFEYGFGTSMGQDFLDESIKKQIADGSVSKCAEHSLKFIAEHFYKS